MQETPTEIRLIKPGANSGAEVVSEVLGSSEVPRRRPTQMSRPTSPLSINSGTLSHQT